MLKVTITFQEQTENYLWEVISQTDSRVPAVVKDCGVSDSQAEAFECARGSMQKFLTLGKQGLRKASKRLLAGC